MDESSNTADMAPASENGRGRAVESVQAYRLALVAADAAWDDGTALSGQPALADIAGQLLRAAGSISANVAEGYARRSPRDRIRYYEYALGSVEETCSWYAVARRGLPEEVMQSRQPTLTSIRRLLLVMIANERSGKNWNSTPR
jgi:four helix bundle protein